MKPLPPAAWLVVYGSLRFSVTLPLPSFALLPYITLILHLYHRHTRATAWFTTAMVDAFRATGPFHPPTATDRAGPLPPRG